MRLMLCIFVSSILVISCLGEIPPSYIQSSPWTWVCREDRCVKADRDDLSAVEDGNPLAVCKLNCGKYGALWPLPKGKVEIGEGLLPFYPQNLEFETLEGPTTRISDMLKSFSEIFRRYLVKNHPEHRHAGKAPLFPSNTEADELSKNKVKITVHVVHPFDTITLGVDEGYLLTVQKQDDGISALVNIQANTYFGARHALETLSQLVAFDEEKNALQIVTRAVVQDRPEFQYRGIIVDTSRNFIPIPRIRKLIDGMSYNKLNMFHWHLTDTHSFPFYSKSYPQMTKYGAYSPKKIYTVEQMKDLVEYALIRGVKIVPELDAPAHVGNGWQWGPAAGKGNLAVCINQEPWQSYCVEPPCGQINPVNEDMYKVLSELYKDMLEIFDNDLFHMGGDEVNLPCWNSSSEITDYLKKNGKDLSAASFIDLWGDFQSRALALLKDRSSSKNMTTVLWTSELASKTHVQQYLDPKDYVIQIWATGDDPIIPFLIKENYRVIFSNYDAWYFDCGYGGWVGGGPNNWCSPYKGWQQVYGNSPIEIYKNATSEKEAKQAMEQGLILGGEAAMWSEQVDETSIESKIWPRAAALAERLWTNPGTPWSDAEIRMVHNRNRMVERGLDADRLQPEWCHQNEGQCYFSDQKSE